MKSIKFLFLLFSVLTFSQHKIQIFDIRNNKPISYAKIVVDDESSYFANKKGVVTIPSKYNIAFIDVFGFENQKIIGGQEKYYLKPLLQDKQNFTKSKNSETEVIGKINKNSKSAIVGVPGVIFLNLFENTEKVKQSFINKIRFYTNVESNNNAVVNIVLYDIENGFPGKKIGNFLAVCSAGKKVNIINLKDNLISFPKEGIFIGYEWIITEENKYKFNYVKDKNTSFETQHSTNVYNPQIYVQESDKDEVFMMREDKWIEFKSFMNKKDDNINSKIRLSIEIEVIN